MRAKELVDEARDGDKIGLPAERVLQDIFLLERINLPGVLAWPKIFEREIDQWVDELLEHSKGVKPGTVLYESVESHLVDAVLRLKAEVEADEQSDDQCFVFRFSGFLITAAGHAIMNIENLHYLLSHRVLQIEDRIWCLSYKIQNRLVICQ